MILIDFPAPKPVPVELDLICPELGFSNIIALTQTDEGYTGETQGTLSIKCAYGGEETYLVDNNRMAVGDGRYLILNEGERYASEAGDGDIESFCVFFRPGFAAEALRGMVTPDDRLLNDPEGDPASPVHFAEVVYRPDEILTPALHRLRASVCERRHSPGWMEEQFHDLIGRMLLAHRNVALEMRRLPVLRRSTRLELYRRLARGRDFIEALYTEPIGLAAMARAASMAPHHFLRNYKRTFGRTPHQHLTTLRIERARHLLATTDLPITRICLDVGFESSTSFALLFKRYVGMTPSAYRGREAGDQE